MGDSDTTNMSLKILFVLSILVLAMVSAALQTDEDRYVYTEEEADVVAVDGSAEAMDDLDDNTRRKSDGSVRVLVDDPIRRTCEAVEAAMRVFEDDPAFDAGCGSVVNEEVLTAKFRSDDFTANIQVNQTNWQRKNNRATWTYSGTRDQKKPREGDPVKHFKFNKDFALCQDSKMSFHVYQYPVSETASDLPSQIAGFSNGQMVLPKGCAGFGGLYDPTYACGYASHNRYQRAQDTEVPVGNTLSFSICDTLKENNICAMSSGKYQMCRAGPESGKCPVWQDGSSPPPDQSQCEIGDLSGKMGKIIPTDGWASEQKFKDMWMEPITNLKGRSLLLKCEGLLFACANLK